MSIYTQKNTEIVRVHVNDLVDEYPGYTFVTFQGKPFTGLGFETMDDGRTISETTYVDGAETGPYRTWYLNGQLESEGESRLNRLHGFFKEWHESGQLKAEGLIELGTLIWRKDWDEEGNLIEDYKIEDYPSRLKSLKSSRSLFKEHDSSYINLSTEHE